MKTCTLTEARRRFGAVCDAAIKGRPTVIRREGHLVIVQAYEPAEPVVRRPPGYFATCYTDAEEINRENRCGRASD